MHSGEGIIYRNLAAEMLGRHCRGGVLSIRLTVKPFAPIRSRGQSRKPWKGTVKPTLVEN